MVLTIEKISPSDFGNYKTLFENELPPSVYKSHKQYLKTLFFEYKSGALDSTKLDRKLELFFNSLHKKSVDKK
jgi:hypothetical protein